jgi:signal peptidase II
MKSKTLSIVIFVCSAALVFAADWVTKAWAVQTPYRKITLLREFFYLAPYSRNDGIAFGIDVPMALQIAGTFIILGFLIAFFYQELYEKKVNLLKSVLLGIIMGGAIGNLADRLQQGSVIDFIALGPIPLFNIADIGITVGVLLLAVLLLREEMKNKP